MKPQTRDTLADLRRALPAKGGEPIPGARTLFDSCPDGMVLIDADGRILDANLAQARMYGYEAPADMIGLAAPHLVAPACREQAGRIMARRLAGEDIPATQYQLLRRDGSVFFGETTANLLKDGNGRCTGYICVTRDTTERERRDREVRESEDWFQRIFRSSPAGILLTELVSGRILDANDRICGLLHFDREELLNHSLVELGLLSAEAREAPIRAIREQGRMSNHEMTVLDRSGKVLHLLYSGEAVTLSGSEYLLSIVSDITEEVQLREKHRLLESQMQQLHRMDSLGRLAGGVAHDMNNILGAILAVTQTARAQGDGTLTFGDALDLVERAAVRGKDLVRSLLSFARTELGTAMNIDLNEMVRQEMALLDRTLRKKFRLAMDLEEGLPLIQGEAGSLGSALMNLCVNAVDAMGEGGTLTIRTRRVGGTWVEVEVEDTGEGMDPETLNRAMEPFFTTKAVGKGTGLGLSMVFHAARAHGGTLVLQSEPGRGTRACLRLPASAEEQEMAAAMEPTPAPTPSLAILVVDDDDMMRSTVPRMLEILGHRVAAADSGGAALARLDQGEVPDLILLDLNMPVMSGLETLRHIRSRFPDLPVLLATGFLDGEAEAVVEADRHARVISKPFSIYEIQQKVGQVLGSGARGPRP